MNDRLWVAWGIILVVSVASATTWLDHKFGDGTTDKVVNFAMLSAVGAVIVAVVAWAVWTVCGGGA